MPHHRRHAWTLALALGLGLQAAGVEAADPSPVPVPAPSPEALVVPFAHRVGERWGLAFERERRVDDGPSAVESQVAEVHVLSLYGRDLLVEVAWRSVTLGGGVLALEPRRPASEMRLDVLGGGRWLLRVDVRGTALALLNDEEVRAAFARARGTALDEEEWLHAVGEALDVWNVVYAACGVPLVPSAARVTPLGAAAAPFDVTPDSESEAMFRAGGEDVRVLNVERDQTRVTALAVHARTRLHEGTPTVHLERNAGTRYDVASRRLSGWQLSVRRGRHGQEVERLTFAELAPPAPPVASEALASR